MFCRIMFFCVNEYLFRRLAFGRWSHNMTTLRYSLSFSWIRWMVHLNTFWITIFVYCVELYLKGTASRQTVDYMHAPCAWLSPTIHGGYNDDEFFQWPQRENIFLASFFIQASLCSISRCCIFDLRFILLVFWMGWNIILHVVFVIQMWPHYDQVSHQVLGKPCYQTPPPTIAQFGRTPLERVLSVLDFFH